MPELTNSQQKVDYVGGTISALLSIIGSSLIILSVRRKRKNNGTYERIMQRMSIFDAIHSTALIFMPYLTPSDSGVWSGLGNDTTCTIMGFFAQLGMAVYCYSNSLNTLYVLIVVFGTSDGVIVRRYEPWFHVISIGFPLITAIVGVCMNVYSPSILGYACWIGVDQHVFLGTLFALPFFCMHGMVAPFQFGHLLHGAPCGTKSCTVRP